MNAPDAKYTDSEGKEHIIAEMNAYHIVNAYAKIVRANEAGRVKELATDEIDEAIEGALRTEIMNRLAQPKAV